MTESAERGNPSWMLGNQGAQVSPDDYCETVELPFWEQSEYMTESAQRDNPFWTFGNQGAQVSPDDYCETVELTCFEQTECMTESEERHNPPWILGNQDVQMSPDDYCETVEFTCFKQTEYMIESEQRDNLPWTFGYPDAQVSPDDSCEKVELPCFKLTEYMTESEHGDNPTWTFRNQGAQVSPDDYCETMEISCFEPSEYMTESEKIDNPSWTLGNQGSSSTNDSRRPNSEHEHFSFSGRLREHMENPQSDLTFTTPCTSQESTTEALIEEPSTRTQRRSRSKRPRNHSDGGRDESSSHPNKKRELVMRFHDSISPETSESNETETFSRNEPNEITRHQISRPVSQNRDNFAASGLSSHFSGEYSTHTTRNREPTQLRTRRTFLVPDLQITLFPGEDSPSDDINSITPFIPETVYNSDSVESVLEEIRNIFSRAEEAGVRSNVGTLRIPAFRSSNTGLNDTRSIATLRTTLEQTMSGFSGSSNLMDTGGDLQCGGLPPTQNVQRAESQNRRDGSNLNPSYESHSVYNPSFSYITGSSSSPVFSASSHNEYPEIAPVMVEDINERSASLGSQSQPRQASQHARSEISNENEPWLPVGELIPIDESIFHPPGRLTKQQIDHLPVRTFDKNDAAKYCRVCITRYRKGSKVHILPCSHEYHIHCIDPWLLENSTCPICRSDIISYEKRENS